MASKVRGVAAVPDEFRREPVDRRTSFAFTEETVVTDKLKTLLAHAGQASGLNRDQLANTIVDLCAEFEKLAAVPQPSAQQAAAMDGIVTATEACVEEDRRRRIDSALAASGGPRGTAISHIAKMAAQHGMAEPSGGTQRSGRNRVGALLSASPVTITAAVGSSRIPAGSPLMSSGDLGEVMAESLERMAPTGSAERRRRLIACARWEYPEERQLGADSAINTERLDAVCRIDAPRYDRKTGALTASGGICGPTGVDYSVPTWSTADRPLRDGLPAFQATRGGITYVTPPDIGVPDLQGTASGAGLATRVWTEATDADPGLATKPVWQVSCGTPETVYVNAVPTRVQFGNMQSRFAPEQVAANTEQAIATAAREAELELLSLLYAASKQVKPQQYLGAARDLLSSVDLLREQYLYSHRIPRTAAFDVVFPAWAQGLLRADLARELAHGTSGGDRLAVTDEQIDDWFAVRGINVIWTLDGLKAGTYGIGGSAITNQFFPLLADNAPEPQWPGQSADGSFMVAWLMYVTGTFQFLDGGRLDLGVVRDSILDATNDYEVMVEPFESVAFRGVEAYQVQSTILPTGGSGATVAASAYHE